MEKRPRSIFISLLCRYQNRAILLDRPLFVVDTEAAAIFFLSILSGS